MRFRRQRITFNLMGSLALPTNWEKQMTRNDKVKVERMVRKCMNVLKKKEYELDLTKADVDRAVKVTRLVDKEWCNGATYGGRNVIQINLSYWQHSDKPHYEREYKAYDADKVIGGRQVKNLEESLWMTVAHEVAHHIQRAYCPRIKRFAKNHRKPHGDCFKTIYRYLRKDFINPMLDA